MRLQSRHQTLQKTLDTAYEDRVRGVLSEGMFVRKRDVWERELADVAVKLERLGKATRSYQDEALKLLKLTEVAEGQYFAASVEKRADILRCMCSNLTCTDGSWYPAYRKPFDVLANLGSGEEWRTQGNSARTPLIELCGDQVLRIQRLERLVA